MSNHQLSQLLRKDFPSFVAKAFFHCDGRALQVSGTYIEYVCYVLMQFIKGETKGLLINLPGRHLKTFICSICLPAFLLGLDPSLRLLIAAYDKSLAEDIVRQIREIMESSWYKAVFDTRISPKHRRKQDFAVIGGGRVRAVSIRRVTGKGGHIIIFDDPHNALDWNDPEKKEQVIDAFAALLTRRDKGVNTQFVVVGHRVAPDDLPAYIIERGEFEHLCLPLFAPEAMEFDMGNAKFKLAKGEALRPDAFPAHSIERLRRDHRGSPFWLHCQQGLGSSNDDCQIAVTDFPFFDGDHHGLPVVISVDPALKTESTSQNVVHVYAVDGERYILLQAFAERCTFKRLRTKILYYIRAFRASVVLVENTARGPILIEELTNDTGATIVAVNPRGSKLDRLRTCSPIIRAQRVLVREGKEEAERAVDQIVAYPNCLYDDHVDAMTNFLTWIMQQRVPIQSSVQPSRELATLSLGSIRAPRSEVRGGVARCYSERVIVEPKPEPGSPSPYQARVDPTVVIIGGPADPTRIT